MHKIMLVRLFRGDFLPILQELEVVQLVVLVKLQNQIPSVIFI